MKVSVYPDGNDADSVEYHDTTPEKAAELFADDGYHAAAGTVDLVCVPADDEARAIPGWKSGIDGPFRLFKVRGTVTWAATEVASFNPCATGEGGR